MLPLSIYGSTSYDAPICFAGIRRDSEIEVYFRASTPLAHCLVQLPEQENEPQFSIASGILTRHAAAFENPLHLFKGSTYPEAIDYFVSANLRIIAI